MRPIIVDADFKATVLNCTSEEYHNIKDAVHSSSLKNILKSPHAYDYFMRHPKEQTSSMKFGTLAHGVILEGQSFLNQYVVQPVFKGLTLDGKETTSMNSKAVKQQHVEWLASLPEGTKIMTQDEHDKMMFMLDSLLRHKFVQEVFKAGFPEFKKQWRDPVTGLKCVSSDDFVSFEKDIWIDIKTTPNCDWDHFRKSVENYGYDFQCAFYQRGHKAVYEKELTDKLWIAIESQPPWECKVHYVNPFYLEAGEYQVKQAMRDLSHCLKTNEWPQGQVVIEAGEPSVYYKNQYEMKMGE